MTDEHDMNEAMKTWPEEPTQEVPEKPESPIPGASVESMEQLTLGLADLRITPGTDGLLYVFLRTGKGENDEEEHWKGLGMPPELALAFGGAMAEAASEMLFPEMVFAMDNPKGRQDN